MLTTAPTFYVEILVPGWSDWAWWLPDLLDILADDADPWGDFAWLAFPTGPQIFHVGYTGQANDA